MKFNELTIVRTVKTRGDSVLVEYVENGLLIRRYIPIDKLSGNQVPNEVLKMGIPYGYQWKDIKLSFDMEKFANELHNLGIWTIEELLKNPQKVWSALHAALADNFREVLDIAKKENKRS